MILTDVMEEIAAKLDTITGLRAYAYPPDKIAPPAAFVVLPETYTFDATYGRGSDEFTLTVNVLVGKANTRAAIKACAAYANGSGARSVKAKLDSSSTNTYASCDDVHVSSVAFSVVTVGAVDYLAALFDVPIVGPGS